MTHLRANSIELVGVRAHEHNVIEVARQTLNHVADLVFDTCRHRDLECEGPTLILKCNIDMSSTFEYAILELHTETTICGNALDQRLDRLVIRTTATGKYDTVSVNTCPSANVVISPRILPSIELVEPDEPLLTVLP